MPYNDLQEKCKCCAFNKPYGLHMDGNHVCVCMKHQQDFYKGRTEKCGFFEPIDEEVIAND